MEGVLDSDEPLHGESYDEPHGQEGEDGAQVDEGLTPAFPVEHLEHWIETNY